MTEQTDRIRDRLDVVEARAQAALSTLNEFDLEVADPPTPWPRAYRIAMSLQTSQARAFFIAAHNPTVVLAQVEDYRQQIEDAEDTLSACDGPSTVPEGYQRALHQERSRRSRTAQDRLDRLDRLTALMTGES